MNIKIKTKLDARAYFGSYVKLAAGLEVTKQCVSNWPMNLKTEQSDRIVGAIHRLKLKRIKGGCHL